MNPRDSIPTTMSIPSSSYGSSIRSMASRYAAGVLEQGRDVVEEDPGLGEVGDLADLRAKLLGRHAILRCGRGSVGRRARGSGARRRGGAPRSTAAPGARVAASSARLDVGRHGAAAGAHARKRRHEPTNPTGADDADARTSHARPDPHLGAGPRGGRDERAADAGPERRAEHVRQLQRRRRRALAARAALRAARSATRRIAEADPEPGERARRRSPTTIGTCGQQDEHRRPDEPDRHHQRTPTRTNHARPEPRDPAGLEPRPRRPRERRGRDHDARRPRRTAAPALERQRTYASAPKNENVSAPRSRIAAGRPRASRSVPGGVSARNAGIPSDQPDDAQRDARGQSARRRQAGERAARPEGQEQRQRHAPPGARPRRRARASTASPAGGGTRISGGSVSAPATAMSGSSPMNTSAPVELRRDRGRRSTGPKMPGTTHAVASSANICGRSRSGMLRPMAT